MPLERSDLTGAAGELDATIRAEIAAETARPFDLERGPLVRARLLVCGERHHVLIFTAHHIVCDGWSIGVFMSDLAAYYHGRSSRADAALPPLPVQYGDYAHWQHQHHDGGRLAAQLDYWAEQLAGLPTIWLPWAMRARVARRWPRTKAWSSGGPPANTARAAGRTMSRLVSS